MIEPTPGRVVWYRAKESEVGEAGLTPNGNKPLAAHVAFVHSPTTINVMIIDAKGRAHGRESVQLVHEGDVPEGACTWMPYQKGQAAKAEQLEQKLAEKPAEPPAPPKEPVPPAPEKPADPPKDPEQPQT